MIGKKYVVTLFSDDGFPIPLSMTFIDSGFSYNDGAVSSVIVKKEDIAGTYNDQFTVTYFFIDGDEWDLSTVSVDWIVQDAASKVNDVLPESFGLDE